MAKNNDYYDFEIDIEKLIGDSGLVDEAFYFKDLKQRKLFLNSEIDQSSIADIVKHIFQYNAEDAGIPPEGRRPILLYITSMGGYVDDGYELVDAIKVSQTPVYTVNLGYWYSMGLLIGMAGHKRYALPNSKCLMHDGSNFVFNSGAKAQDHMEFQRKVSERVKNYIITNSKLTEEEYDSKLRVEWYMFADEAKEKGFIDYIIGEDCEISEVV